MDQERRTITKREKAWLIERYRDRQPQMLAELGWALGLRVPGGNRKPPKWVKRCISRLLLDRSRPPTLKDASKRKLSVLLAGKLEGATRASLAALSFPSEDEARLEEVKPEIRELRLVAKSELEKLLKKEHPPKPGDVRPADMTAEEWSRYFEEAEEAAVDLAEGKPGSISEDILWWIWFFWPDAEGTKSRGVLHEWMSNEMRFVECDFKIFEKVCRQIRFRSLGSKARLRTRSDS